MRAARRLTLPARPTCRRRDDRRAPHQAHRTVVLQRAPARTGVAITARTQGTPAGTPSALSRNLASNGGGMCRKTGSVMYAGHGGQTRHNCARLDTGAGVPHAAPHGSAADDEQERRVTLLLFGKGAVLARWLMRPLAVEMDESEQSPGTRRREPAGCSFPRMRASPPAHSSRPLWTISASTWRGSVDARFPRAKAGMCARAAGARAGRRSRASRTWPFRRSLAWECGALAARGASWFVVVIRAAGRRSVRRSVSRGAQPGSRFGGGHC